MIKILGKKYDVNTITLDLSYQQLDYIPKEINQLTNLQIIYLNNNQITQIPKEFLHKISFAPKEILQNRKLINFYYNGNQIEHIPPNVQRFLNRLNHRQDLYNDTQSVHNHQIQESIRNSINKIISVKPTITNEQMLSQIMSDNILTNKTKEILLEYYNQNDIHSVLDITFGEL